MSCNYTEDNTEIVSSNMTSFMEEIIRYSRIVSTKEIKLPEANRPKYRELENRGKKWRNPR